MKVVIDTNVLFSFFKSDSSTRQIIINTPLKLYAPKEMFDELTKYKDEICNKSQITTKEFEKIITTLPSFIDIISKQKFVKSYEKAKSLLPDYAKDDAPFIGLALYLGIPLWSNDKAIKTQDKVKVFSTSELIKILDVNKYFFS